MWSRVFRPGVDMDYVTLTDIQSARERIRPAARYTPLIEAGGLWLKAESLQPMGAFKIRGAYNMISQLSKDQLQRGVITYSSGNHGQAVALAAQQLGAPAVIVMPTTAPAVKVEGCKSYGAEVIMEGTTSLHRQARAEKEAAERGLTIVPPFDHQQIIIGQGTVGLEILEQLPDVGTVFVPAGGGGLASGTAAAIKQSKPAVRIVAGSGCPGHVAVIGEHRRRVDEPAAGRHHLRAHPEVRGRSGDGERRRDCQERRLAVPQRAARGRAERRRDDGRGEAWPGSPHGEDRGRGERR
jgi:cysteine synthase